MQTLGQGLDPGGSVNMRGHDLLGIAIPTRLWQMTLIRVTCRGEQSAPVKRKRRVELQ